MISQESEFEFINRGFKDTIVLVPGWATDYRVFSTLSLNYNYIATKKLNPFDFSDRFLQALSRESIERVSLFGWSLGAFLAVEFALNNSERVNQVILSGIRERYETAALEGIKQKIIKNKKAYLIKFYHDCFSDSRKVSLMWFKKHLLKDYLDAIRVEDLILGLEYLSKAKIDAESLRFLKKIRIFHGLEDKIAPVNEARQMKRLLPGLEFIFVPDSGHAVFLNSGFKERLENE